jgi:FKBP-type peptidyl-prolyl cis-trans isomerase
MKIAYFAPWLPFWIVLLSKNVAGFMTQQQQLSSYSDQPNRNCRRSVSTSMATSKSAAGELQSWENLVPEKKNASPVWKTVLRAASSEAPVKTPEEGSVVTIEYTGSLWMDADDDGFGSSITSWDTAAVLECWLSEQQGLFEILSGPFEEKSVDGSTLLDEEIFTEAFVAETLGVDNKIRCKKTTMAAKRLRSTIQEFAHGKVFDSSDSKPEKSYEFVLGAGKTIRAMELLVASMEEGESSRVVARCDYGYGADGYRTNKGDVLVPPFCGLAFDVTLLSVQ